MRVSSDGGFTWSNPTQIKGESLYTWIAYADNQAGSGLSSTPVDGSGNYKSFIGYAYNMASEMPEAPDPELFTWSPYVYRLLASLLQIVSGGAIYSGYSQDGTPPATGAGFWLGADGVFKAVKGEFSGTLSGASGVFSGDFETPTLVAKPGTQVDENYVSAYDSDYQARNIYDYYTGTHGLDDERYYPCAFNNVGYENVAYVRMGKTLNWGGRVDWYWVIWYDSDLNEVVGVRTEYFDGVLVTGEPNTIRLPIAIDIDVTFGGEELSVFNLPLNPSTTEIDAFDPGRVWREQDGDTSTAFLKIKL
jgi:hypothetical protein